MTMFQNLHRMMSCGATLKIACEVCPHSANWTSDQAFQRLGSDATPFEIRRRRFRCTGCGRVGCARVSI